MGRIWLGVGFLAVWMGWIISQPLAQRYDEDWGVLDREIAGTPQAFGDEWKLESTAQILEKLQLEWVSGQLQIRLPVWMDSNRGPVTVCDWISTLILNVSPDGFSVSGDVPVLEIELPCERLHTTEWTFPLGKDWSKLVENGEWEWNSNIRARLYDWDRAFQPQGLWVLTGIYWEDSETGDSFYLNQERLPQVLSKPKAFIWRN